MFTSCEIVLRRGVTLGVLSSTTLVYRRRFFWGEIFLLPRKGVPHRRVVPCRVTTTIVVSPSSTRSIVFSPQTGGRPPRTPRGLQGSS